MWTPEAIAAKRGLVQACAYKHWAKWRGTLDRSFLEDLEQEAWVAALAVDPEHPYLAQKLDDALRTAIRYWRLGYRAKSSTTAPRQIWQPVPLERLAPQQALLGRAPMGPEASTMLRQQLRRIWRRATRRMRHVWWAQLLENSLYIKGVEARRLGLSTHQLSRARRQLQRLATAVITGVTR